MATAPGRWRSESQFPETRMETTADVAVVGAGPVGCVTALACARRGARVVLLEAQAQATSRMAGEWLHPSAVGVLQRLGIGRLEAAADHAAGKGFTVFPGPGGALPPGPPPALWKRCLTLTHGRRSGCRRARTPWGAVPPRLRE